MPRIFDKLKNDNPEKYPKRMGMAWSENEQNQLLSELQKKVPIDMIAELHERTNGSIRSRLREIAANYYFNNNLQISEIQKYTGLSIEEISDAISRRENREKSKEVKEKEKQTNKQVEIQRAQMPISENISDTKEIILLLKDIKELLQKFLNNIHYEE